MVLMNLWEPCYSAKFPDDPQTYTVDVLWLQEEEEEEEDEDEDGGEEEREGEEEEIEEGRGRFGPQSRL